jgi:hypothetical protein
MTAKEKIITFLYASFIFVGAIAVFFTIGYLLILALEWASLKFLGV